MDTGRQKMWFGDAKRHYEHRRQTPQKNFDGRWTPMKIPPRTLDAKPIPPLYYDIKFVIASIKITRVYIYSDNI